jgi:hypothetical protein
MNLIKKLAVGLLMAGTMTGVGLSVASPAGAATSMSTATSVSATVPQAGFPRWESFGFYPGPTSNACAAAGRMFLKEGSNVGDWRCTQIPSGPEAGKFHLELLITPP